MKWLRKWLPPLSLPLFGILAVVLVLKLDLWIDKPWISTSLIVLSTAFQFAACVWCVTRERVDRLLISQLFSITSLHLMLTIALFALLYRHYGIVDALGSRFDGRLDCLYFSLTTWTTVGYGDFVPSPRARMIAATEAMLGYLFMGLFLATLFHLLSELKRANPRNIGK